MPDKVALLTGAGGYLGQAMVHMLVGQGYHVYAFDKQTVPALEKVTPVQCDLCNETELDAAWQQHLAALPSIDLLINNAGLIHSEPLVSLLRRGNEGMHSMAMWHKVVGANLTSAFAITRYVAQHMAMKRHAGTIVNISSVSARGNAGQSAYSAAKAGVEAMTKCWAKELAPMGIRVVALAPGYVDTPSTHNAMSEATLQRILSQTSLKRLITVQELLDSVQAVIENPAINGTVVDVDGGMN